MPPSRACTFFDNDRKAVRAVTGAWEDPVRTRIALAKELRDHLAWLRPGARKVFCQVEWPIAVSRWRSCVATPPG